MEAVFCFGGFQCMECLHIMYVNEAEKKPYTMKCVNSNCVEYDKLYKVPVIQLELEVP